jgi:hypothetical protein
VFKLIAASCPTVLNIYMVIVFYVTRAIAKPPIAMALNFESSTRSRAGRVLVLVEKGVIPGEMSKH